MSLSLSRSIISVLVGSVLASGAFAQSGPRINVRPQVRVVDKVDSKKSTVLANTTPSVVANAVDNGRLAASTQLGHMMLVLKSSDEQELALHGLLDDQQDKSSPNYHKWMTPDTFGTTFGAASTDIAKVTAWLQDSGFSVETVARGGRVISFSGSVGQVESAFQTEMHHITVGGEAHISNTKDISVPSALSPIIKGVSALNDFRPKAHIVNKGKVSMGSDGQFHPVIPGTSRPDLTFPSSGNHYVVPGDIATIYNANPLLASGIDGTGVTIGILGQTSVALADIQAYRSIFNLPVNDPQIINVDNVPATIADDFESDLDLELAGALATGAKIKFYTAPSTGVDGGVDTSALAVVDTNGADIISLSYGGCEYYNGAAGTAYWNSLWEQAAAQGQTVFVSTGDFSAALCATGQTTTATGNPAGTYAVNTLGSSPYNVAVGGSMFNEGATALTTGATPYWGAPSAAPFNTALSYIPETVWSEGSFDMVQASTGYEGGSGGVSMFTARPSWQVGPGITAADPAGPTFTVSGAIPAGTPHRLVPDVSMIAASNHDGTIVCAEGSCELNADGSIADLGVVGGTSVAAPTMAGIQALINQKNGGRQGNANYYYYKLAAAQTTANCASTLPPAANCNFNDIVSGDNYAPKTSTGKYNISTGTISGTLGTDYFGFPATTGFDEASGLGTPNITNVANNWSTVTFNATKTALTLTPVTTVHGTAMTAVINVTASAGTPTGDVSLTAIGQSAGAGDANVYTLSGGTVTAAVSSLPGGTYSVTAHYAGDSVYGASDSAPVVVTISKEPSNTSITTYNLVQAVQAGQTVLLNTTVAAYVYGTSIDITTQVQGNSATGYTNNGAPNTGAPTGTMTYTLTSGATALPTYVATVNPGGNTSLEVAQNFTGFDVYANYPALSPGTYGVQTAYSGDISFGTSSATSSITVVQASVKPTLRTSSAEIASGATATFNVTIAASGGGVLPTGTVTLTDTTTSTVLGSGTFANGAVVITTNLIKTNGAHSITATYGGDNNYATTVSTATTVTVGGTATTLALTSTVSTAKVLASVPLVATAPAGVTGAVYFYDGAVSLGAVNLSTTTHTATLNVVTLTAGTHSITANYAGSTTYQSATSLPLSLIITQNTPALQFTSQETNASGVNVAETANLTFSPTFTTTAGANPAPSVPIQFLDGTTVLNSVPLTFTPNYYTYVAANTIPGLKPGPHSLSAKFAGDLNYAAATSNVQIVNIGLTTTTLTASSNNVGTNMPFTLTSTVTPQVANATPVTGTVSFYNGATLLGTATVTNGTATLTTAALTGVGTFNLTAVYSGDSNYYKSTSTNTVTVSSVTPSFTIAVTPPSITITRGGSGTLQLTATAVGNYNGFGNLSCQGLPTNTFCSFSQPAVLLDGTNGTTMAATITVYTTYAVSSNKAGPLSSIRSAGLLWIPAILLAGLLGLRRKQLSLRGRQMMAFAILLCGMMAVSGCNDPNGGLPPAGSTVGTSTITVAAAGNGVTTASPNITPTTTFTLTIR